MWRHIPHFPNAELLLVHHHSATKLVELQLRSDFAADLCSDGNNAVIAIGSDAFGRNEAIHVDQGQLGAGVGEKEILVAGVKTDEGGEEVEGAGGQVHDVMGECFGRDQCL